MKTLYECLEDEMITESGNYDTKIPNDMVVQYTIELLKNKKPDPNIIKSEFDKLFKASEEINKDLTFICKTDSQNHPLKLLRDSLNLVLQTYPENENNDGFYHKISSAGIVTVYYKSRKVFIVGDGSYNKNHLPTIIHEVLSSIFINTEEKYHDKLIEIITNMYSDYNLDKWIKTFKAQDKAIKQYIGTRKLRAVRIGDLKTIASVYHNISNNIDIDVDLNNTDKKLISVYNDISEKYKYFLKSNVFINSKSMRREAFDKSDMYLYDPSKINEFFKFVDNIDDNIDMANMKTKMVNLFHNDILIGVSLKGLSYDGTEYNISEFNVDKDFDNGYVKPVVEYKLEPIIRKRSNGKIDLQNGFRIHTKTEDGKTFLIEMRSFGNPGMDIKTDIKKPTLGKTPITFWRELMDKSRNNFMNDISQSNLKTRFKSKDYNEIAKRFGLEILPNPNLTFEFEKTNRATVLGLKFLYVLGGLEEQEIKSTLTKFIKTALAESNYSFPFILTDEK